MKCIKSVMVSLVAVAVMLAASVAKANDYSVSGLASNLQVNAGAGVAHTPGQTAMFETVGLSVGLPVTRVNGIVIGAQVGGDTALNQIGSRNIQTADATVGLFARNITTLWSGHQVAFAALFDYDYTTGYRNLVSFRPVAGVTLTKQDEVFLTGSTGVISDHGDYVNDFVQAGWTRDWNKNITSQARLGWQFEKDGSRLEQPVGGASLEYRLTRNLSVVVSGDLSGNNSRGVDSVALVSFVIGGAGQSGSVLSQIGGDRLTPFNR